MFHLLLFVVYFLAGILVVGMLAYGFYFLVFGRAILRDGAAQTRQTGLDDPSGNRKLRDALTFPERQQIVQEYFSTSTIVFQRPSDSDDLEAAKPSTDAPTDIVSAPHNENNDTDHDKTCAICLSNYENGDFLTSSKHCNHKAHAECLQTWLMERTECPFCREEMITEEDWIKTAVSVLDATRVQELFWIA